MGQLLIRQLDDLDLDRLRVRARAEGTSVESLAREAVREAAQKSVEDKRALVREMQAWSRRVRNPNVPRTLGVDLIREDRDLDH